MNRGAWGSYKRIATRLVLTLLLLLAAVSIVRAGHSAIYAPFGSGDLGMTLKAADVLKDENPYTRYFREGPVGGGEKAPGPEANPWGLYPMQMPSVLMLLWPLTPLDWQTAQFTWFFLNLGFTFGCLLLIARQFVPRGGHGVMALIAALFMISYPWRILVAGGQHLIAGMFFFLLSVELANRGHKAWAAVALACSFIKYTTTLFLLPYLVWKRQWLPLAGALGLHALMTVVVAIWVEENPVQLVVQAIQAASFYQVDQGTYQANDGFIDLFAVSRSLGLPLGFPLTAALLGTAVTYWLAVRRRGGEAMFLSLLCFWSYVAMYHRAYDAVILLIPLAIALSALRVQPMPSGLVLAVVAFSWIADRFASQFTDWLDVGSEGRQSLYYAAMVSVYYGTLLSLFYWQVRSPGEGSRWSVRRTGAA